MIDLDPNEKIIAKVRRHKFALILESLFLSIFIIFPPVVYYLIGVSNFKIQTGGSIFFLFLYIYSVVLLFVWVIFFKIWTDYYLDILVVTNKRIIDVEQKGFFHRDIATVRLDNIQDIRVNIKGILATFLDYGEVHIQTASESREFVMHFVPKPNKIKAMIYDLHDKMIEAPKSVRMVQ
jgi:hypothetical protein